VIVVEGLEEAQVFIAGLKLTDADWQKSLEKMGGELRRFAASVSPVITGSYRDSHRAVVDRKIMTLSIDPAARNTATGTPVTRYAGAVEQRHHVYAGTFFRAIRLAVTVLEDLLRGKGL